MTHVRYAIVFFACFFSAMFHSYGMSVQNSDLEVNWSEWKHLLLTDPVAAQQRALSVYLTATKPDKTKIDYSLCSLFYDSLKTGCPFFCVQDCGMAGSFTDRATGHRAAFERVVIYAGNMALEKDPQAELVYLGFASGKLFPDFLVILHLLERNPSAKISFIGVDPVYEDLDLTYVLKLQMVTCIKNMFPNAQFTIRLIDNSNMSLEQVVGSLGVSVRLVTASALTEFDSYAELLAQLFCKQGQYPLNFLLSDFALHGWTGPTTVMRDRDGNFQWCRVAV